MPLARAANWRPASKACRSILRALAPGTRCGRIRRVSRTPPGWNDRMPELITSAQNPTIKFIRALERKKYRQETGLFVAEGLRALERARLAGISPDYVLATRGPQDWGQVHDLRVSEAVMARLSAQNNPAGLIGVFKQTAVLCDFTPGSNEVVIALEDIRDPGNLGTIMRTADAVAVHHIALVGESCD